MKNETKNTRHHYYWVSPRGFANEGDYVKVPIADSKTDKFNNWYSDIANNVSAVINRVPAKNANNAIDFENYINPKY